MAHPFPEFVHELKMKQFAPVTPTAAKLWPTCLSMLVLAMLVYLPAALGAEFLQFDDNFFFGPDNPEFQKGLREVATTPIANAYLPVAHVSLWFDYQLGGGGPLLPHLHALLLHALVGIVLARLLLQLGLGVAAAHIAAALFVVHPALSESVAWVSSRKSVLSGLFVFLALFQVVRFAHRPSLWRAGLLALLAALAMYSNATAVVLPLLAIGLVLWSRGPRVRWLGPLALLGVTIPIALQHQSIAAAEGTLVGGELAARLPQAPGAFWHYLTTAFWPTGLNVLYPEVDTLASFREQSTIGAIAFGAVALAGLATWWWRSTRPLAAGLLAFVVALLPFNTAYPASSIAAADRYLYLAIPGLAVALAASLQLLHARAPWFAAVLLLPLVWLGGVRAHEFRNDQSLWLASLRANENNAVAHLNLVEPIGRRIKRTGMVSVAELEDYVTHLRAAVRSARYPIHELRARLPLLDVHMARAEYEDAAMQGRAAVVAAHERLQKETHPKQIARAQKILLETRLAAIRALRLSGDDDAYKDMVAQALREAPEDPTVIAFVAIRDLADRQPELLALAEKGKEPRLPEDDAGGKAIDAKLSAARERSPTNAELWLAQALWDRARDRVLPALRGYREAMRLQPTSVEAWLGASRMLRERKSYEDAAGYARQGLTHRPDPRLRQELALSLVGLNRFDEAELHLEAYMRLNPDDHDSGKILANLLIGRAYTQLAETSTRDETVKLVERALQYNPNEPKAHLVLGRLAREERRFLAAVRHLEKAYELLPEFDDARLQFAEALAAFGYERLLKRDDMAATDSWLHCLEIAPPGFDDAEIKKQLQSAWTRLESRGVELLGKQDLEGAEAAFRRCLRIEPKQHWAAWLLATVLQRDPDTDLDELEDLCRKALSWQQDHGLDTCKQSYLLAETLAKKGERDAAREVAKGYLESPAEDAPPLVIAALKKLAEL